MVDSPLTRKRTSTEANISPISSRQLSSSITDMFTSMYHALVKKSAQHNDPELQQFAEQMQSFSTMIDSINQNIKLQFDEFDHKFNEKLGRLNLPELQKEEYEKIVKREVDDKEKRRSFVIAGLPEASYLLASQRNNFDQQKVSELLDYMDIEATPVAVYRMGRKGSRPRLTKVVMPASIFQRMAIRNSNSLRRHQNGYVREKIFIRPSLTKEEMELFELQRQQVKYLNGTKEKKYCIYAGKISVKSANVESGRREKPVPVAEDKLQELLKEFDVNRIPVNPRRGDANLDQFNKESNFSMDVDGELL